MSSRSSKRLFYIAFFLLGIGLLIVNSGVNASLPKTDHKVYIAFGFHVNLYHSFRIDTNDENGFGKDIKVIRHIVKTLDDFNESGVPVKAVWDFDNLFSLQERLPIHGPDIIRNIKRRVNNNGDEVILMSYNNGLVSAMNHQELTDSIRWSVSNPWGSGVRDLFGQYSPIVRPQEMMTTPGNFAAYKEHGIKAVSLYYSATPFDAFRVFSRPLSRTEAYNPITYNHPRTKEKITIIPTYHIGDLMENVGLRHWADRLHRLQKKGEIDHDVLIYINFDADSEFWRGLDLSWPLDQLPNTGGLSELVNEVKDVDYIRFTSLDAYLKGHPPVGTIFFGQDTADGSFDGYNSWAEKAGSHQYWTRIEEHRRIYKIAKKNVELIGDPSLEKRVQPLLDKLYLKRLRALSTTNFGMATPFLAPQRETVILSLFKEMDQIAERLNNIMRTAAKEHFHIIITPKDLPVGYTWLDTVLVAGFEDGLDSGGRRFLNVKMHQWDDQKRPLFLVGTDGKRIRAHVIHKRRADKETGTWLKLYFDPGCELSDGIYYLVCGPATQTEAAVKAAFQNLKNDKIELRFDSNGKVSGLFHNGVQKLESGSLTPYLRYNGRILHPGHLKIVPSTSGVDVYSVQTHGQWEGPANQTLTTGFVDYNFVLVGDLPYLFVDCNVSYPLTRQRDIIKIDTPALARKLDMAWQEVAPMELRFSHRSTVNDPVRILKYNYLGIESSYSLDYFKHSADNLSLDNINNHITAAYGAAVVDGHGMAVGMDTYVLANFAFMPFKVSYDDRFSAFAVKANPFGTYHGRQYRHPTWGNRQGYDLSIITGEQFHSAAPTYNGQSASFATMLAFFDGQEVPKRVKEDLIRYARPPAVLSLFREADKDRENEELDSTYDLEAIYVENDLYFRWRPMDKSARRYRIHLGARPNYYEKVFTTSDTELNIKSFPQAMKFESTGIYYAVVEALDVDGKVLRKSSEVAFDIYSMQKHSLSPQLSLSFQIKVLWANIGAYLGRYAL